MFCLSFGVLCGDLTFLNGTFWNSVWGIRILECFKKFFIGAEDALRFQELFMENSKNFWTFFRVVWQNQTFWMLNVFLEFLLGVRISDLSFWSSVGIKTSYCLLEFLVEIWISEWCVQVWDQKVWMFFGVFMVVRILECLGKSLVGIRISELFRSSSWEPVSVVFKY